MELFFATGSMAFETHTLLCEHKFGSQGTQHQSPPLSCLYFLMFFNLLIIHKSSDQQMGANPNQPINRSCPHHQPAAERHIMKHGKT
ncbi:hypothetical protein WN943_020176 [Citrus x changshan-huyou]